MIKQKNDLACKIFRNGVKQGLSLHAHWKDGREFVGTCGKTLKEAKADVDAGKYDQMLIYPDEAFLPFPSQAE